ncbi:inactive pancreatic lipase-related protein 1-like [Aplochiton taeniatus]
MNALQSVLILLMVLDASAPRVQFRLWSSSTSNSAEVCYSDLGCFSDEFPWGGTAERPKALLPWEPELIGTRFLLFTPKNPRHYQEIKADRAVLKASNYAADVHSRLIIHGYLDKTDEDWAQEMCKVMLLVENVNCIVVEWKSGLKTQYTQAANNARVVGAQVAHLINFIKSKMGQKTDRFHLIGHSLGAHVAGEAGSRTKAPLGRITGLDPTESYFDGCDVSVRLDPSDALFVDVIHTDALPFNPTLGIGMSQATGHMDFYPNGGEHMPGCKQNNAGSNYVDIDSIWEDREGECEPAPHSWSFFGECLVLAPRWVLNNTTSLVVCTKQFEACNHLRSYQYYLESIIQPHGFTGYPCTDKDTFDSGKCFPCSDKTCPVMGHFADKFAVPNSVSEMKFYLNTGEAQPFGRFSYRALVTLGGKMANLGFLFVALTGSNGNTKEYQLHVGMLAPGRIYEVNMDTEVDIGEATEVKFRWNNHVFDPLRPRYGASKIELVRGSDKTTYVFCGAENVVENAIQTVPLCHT